MKKMKKEYRLLKNEEFKNVLDAKKSVASKEFVIYRKKNSLNHARIGISVSSKVGNSVVRHKIKRQISEMLKTFFDTSVNIDIVIIVRNKFLNNSFFENKVVLEKLLKQ
jgi:ribonuclease P protein component